MEQEQQEFYIVLIVYGGLILSGLLISIGIGMVGIAIWNRHKKGETIKKLYEQERKNGQGGSHGKF